MGPGSRPSHLQGWNLSMICLPDPTPYYPWKLFVPCIDRPLRVSLRPPPQVMKSYGRRKPIAKRGWSRRCRGGPVESLGEFVTCFCWSKNDSEFNSSRGRGRLGARGNQFGRKFIVCSRDLPRLFYSGSPSRCQWIPVTPEGSGRRLEPTFGQGDRLFPFDIP